MDLSILLFGRSPIEIILRAAIIYFFLLFLLRLVGRHEFGQLSTFDLILFLIISESVSNSLSAGDISLVSGIISASTLIAIDLIMDFLKFKSSFIRRLFSDHQVKLIQDGKMMKNNMRRELLTRDDLLVGLREKGVDHIEDVREAYLEPDGSISVLARSQKG
jgi:uncharacterized membrane protein YcaP (DUF421 family)